MNWKTGDWCFHEFKLCQIVVEGAKVQEASDGMFRTSGHDLSYACRPLTLANANLSQHAEHWSEKLHREGHGGLNYPDIHRKMVDLWCIACDAVGDAEKKSAGDAISAFAQAILKAVKGSGEVQGVRLLRRA